MTPLRDQRLHRPLDFPLFFGIIYLMKLDFEIDKLTESIETAQTGESLETLVIPITSDDLKDLTKKKRMEI